MARNAKTRKYGTRENYLKIVKAQAAARKLAKKGVTKVDLSKVTWRINKYGQAVSSSRALNKTAAQWHEATHEGASIRKLTRKQAAALKKEYEHAGSTAPTVKNGRVLVGKGQSLFTRGGRVRIEKSGTHQIGTRIFMTDGWEDRVREYARKHPDSAVLAKQTDLLDKFRSYKVFELNDFGVENLIEYMNRYSDGGHSVTLLRDDEVTKQADKNIKNWRAYLTKERAERRKKQRAEEKARREKVKRQIARGKKNAR